MNRFCLGGEGGYNFQSLRYKNIQPSPSDKVNVRVREVTQSGPPWSFSAACVSLLIASLVNHHHLDEIKSRWTQVLKCPGSKFNQDILQVQNLIL